VGTIIRLPVYYTPELLDHKKEVVVCNDNATHDQTKEDLLLKLRNKMSEVNIEYKDLARTVFSDGDINSPIMVIGEGPGEQESIELKPFVGKSGKLLQEMLDAAGICREKIYVTNVVVWRPPFNRTPLPEEIDAMRPYLMEHIDVINPKVLVLVGGVAYKCVMNSAIAISKIRGQWQSRSFCENIVNIFHPSYLLRSPTHKKETWLDILNVRKKILDLGYEVGDGILYHNK
jgi:uracil-DNA glycosylase